MDDDLGGVGCRAIGNEAGRQVGADGILTADEDEFVGAAEEVQSFQGALDDFVGRVVPSHGIDGDPHVGLAFFGLDLDGHFGIDVAAGPARPVGQLGGAALWTSAEVDGLQRVV